MSKDTLPPELKTWIDSLPFTTHTPLTATMLEVENGVLVSQIVKLLHEEEDLQLTAGSTIQARQANWTTLTYTYSSIR